MGENNDSKLVKKFEELLKQKVYKQFPKIYTSYKNEQPQYSDIKQIYNEKDVITNISAQIKAVHNADCCKSKDVNQLLLKHKSSHFVSVDRLEMQYEVPQKQGNKFETQLELDTQIMNIIDDVETDNTYKGITQEFNMSFESSRLNSPDNKVISKSPEEKENTCRFNFLNNDSNGCPNDPTSCSDLNEQNDTSNNKTDSLKHLEFISEVSFGENINKEERSNNTQLYTNYSELLDKCIEVEENVNLEKVVNNNTNIRPSPIININKFVHKSVNSSPLIVCNLDCFEKFEEIAIPIVEGTTDLEKAKHLINSQIVGRELIIQTHLESDLNEVQEQLSPVLSISKDKIIAQAITLNSPYDSGQTISKGLSNSEFAFNKSQVLELNKCQVNKSINNAELKRDKTKSFEDDILFSSDEETDINKNLQDLPFTCALETSFYDQPDVLDKTMYVGFQTASNRSIQISTVSFTKAKSILDELENKGNTICPSLKDLVEKCDNSFKVNTTSDISSDKIEAVDEIKNPVTIITLKANDKISSELIGLQIVSNNSNDICDENLSKEKVERYIKCSDEDNYKLTKSLANKRKLDGFKTASNKKIKLSNQALARCKRVFQDIKLDDTFGDIDDAQNISIVKKVNNHFINEESIEKERDILDYLNLTKVDDDILQEFEGEMYFTEDDRKKVVTSSDFVGFKTASNKDIKVSDKALAKTKQIFDGIDVSEITSKYLEEKNVGDNKLLLNETLTKKYTAVDKYSNEGHSSSQKHLKTNFMGFKTASNKHINVSENAFARINNIFHDIDLPDLVGLKTKQNETIGLDLIKHSTNVKLQCNSGINPNFRKLNGLPEETEAHFLVENIDKTKNQTDISTSAKHLENWNRPSTSKEHFVGLKTANNNKILISESALNETKNIFKDIHKASEETSKDTINLHFNNGGSENEPEYNSASKSNANIDRVYEVQKAERLLCYNIDNNRNEDGRFTNAKHLRNCSSSGKIQSVEFSTDNENKIKNTEVPLPETEGTFQGINIEMIETSRNVHQFGQTIKENGIVVEESIAKFIQDRNVNEEFDQNFDSDLDVKEPAFKGFKTGNNKPVNISKQALKKSKKIFDNIDIDHKELSKETIFEVSQIEKPVSVEANSKNIIQGIDKENINFKENSFNESQIVNNEDVEISSKALGTSNKVFDGLDLCNNLESNVITFKGFQTASNKPIKISAEALAKTKLIFKDTNENNKENDESEYKLPQTANDKEIKVLTEALVESEKVCDDVKLRGDLNNPRIIKEMVSFSGFQTASNKKVVISEDALQKSKEMLSDINFNVIDNENVDPQLSQVFGFKTANNNNIKISIDALKKSSKLFTEIDSNYKVNENDMDESVINLNIVSEINKKSVKINYNDDSVNCINLDKLINTQVITNFEETLNTEDFLPTPKKPKRSASPILSCPKAKKRKKFETPYTKLKVNKEITIKSNHVEITETFDSDYKKNKRYTLKDLEILNKNEKDKHIDAYILSFDYKNLLEFEFFDQRNDLTESKLTIELLKDYFKKLVNKKLIPDNWLDIQLKLIIWKLLSYELKFPGIMSGICTAKNVLKQLNHRYKRELYNAERPAIRKILERDEVASKLMVLCVVEICHGVEENGVANTTELVLTDGWYCIKACIDKTLVKCVNEGKITVGSKIVTHGAELLNCEQGVAPWEDTSSVRLKLYGNSTRRARWDARLGFYGNAAILSQLSSVKTDGGKVSKLRVLVTRVYPPLYVEKFTDGSTVTRSERLEHIHQMKYESERQALMEKMYEEVERELSDEESPDTDTEINRPSLDSGSQIASLMKRSKEPSQFRANLTDSQKRLLHDHSIKKRDRILQDIQAKVLSKMDQCGLTMGRNVVPVLKVRVAGIEDKNGQIDVVKAQLSIWKPNDALTELITEGAWIEILNVVPTAVRYSELQLSAGRQTIFKRINYKEDEKIIPHIKTLQRTYYSIKDITTHPNMVTDYNEIDTIGIIFQIDPSHREFKSNNQFQNVYLTDENKNIICINFWGGIKKFGFENVLDTGQIVACVNLQKRAGNTRRNIQHYRATEFTYFTKTPKSVAARKDIDELSIKISANNKNKFIDDCVNFKNNLLKCYSENYSPYRFNNHDVSKNKIFIDSPIIPKVNKLQEDLNLSGLDFESTFKHTETQELSPNSLARRKKVNEKIAKLKMYGEPPPLCPLTILNKSKSATKSYKGPLIKDNSVTSAKSDTPNVASMKNKPQNSDNKIDCSPVLSVNRTYVKTINPVKLNFNSVAIEEIEEVDNFAEEFDASPPLSLD